MVRSIYVCIESTLLLYELFSNTPKQHGFKINPYDRFISNKVINIKQCNISFYVDNNKASHVKPEVVAYVINIIKGGFG